MNSITRNVGEKNGNIASYACMALIVPILSSIIPLSLSDSANSTMIAWIACILSVALLVLLVKSFAAVAVAVLALTFSLSYLRDPLPIALILGTILACGVYSAAVAAAKRQHVIFILSAPLISIALVYALTKSISLALLSLASLPPALAMGLGSRRKLDRVRSVALFTAVAAAELLAAVAGYIAWQNGSIDFEIIENAVVYVQNGIEWALRLAIENAGAVSLDETLLIEIRPMSASAINLLPGAIAVALLTVGFFAHKTECSIFRRYEKDSLLESSETPITVSCTAALVFLIAHVFSFTSGASHAPSFIAIAAENLSLMLLPALLLIGWDKVAALPRRIGFLAIAAWIGIVIAANALSSSLISILALIGAFCIIFASTDSWAKDHYRKGEDQ